MQNRCLVFLSVLAPANIPDLTIWKYFSQIDTFVSSCTEIQVWYCHISGKYWIDQRQFQNVFWGSFLDFVPTLLYSSSKYVFFRISSKENIVLFNWINQYFDFYVHGHHNGGEFFNSYQYFNLRCCWTCCVFLHYIAFVLWLLYHWTFCWIYDWFHIFSDLYKFPVIKFCSVAMRYCFFIWFISNFYHDVVETPCIYRILLYICFRCNGISFGLLYRGFIYLQILGNENILQQACWFMLVDLLSFRIMAVIFYYWFVDSVFTDW